MKKRAKLAWQRLLLYYVLSVLTMFTNINRRRNQSIHSYRVFKIYSIVCAGLCCSLFILSCGLWLFLRGTFYDTFNYIWQIHEVFRIFFFQSWLRNLRWFNFGTLYRMVYLGSLLNSVHVQPIPIQLYLQCFHLKLNPCDALHPAIEYKQLKMYQ